MEEKHSFWYVFSEYDIFLIPIIFIATIFAVSMHYHEVDIHSYFPEAIERLDEVSNSIIKEGIGIDVSAIPNDIENIKLERNADEIILSFDLDNNLKYVQSARMTITLSKDGNIISKETNYKSEKQYIESFIFYIFFKSIFLGQIFGLISFFVFDVFSRTLGKGIGFLALLLILFIAIVVSFNFI